MALNPTMPDVATNGEAVFFDGDYNEDLGGGEMGSFSNVSDNIV